MSIFQLDQEMREESPETFELDPRDKTNREKEEPTETVILNEEEPNKTVKVGVSLTKQVKTGVVNLLREYKEIFA